MINIKPPKTLFWTNHAKAKMNFYRLSEQRVRRVLNSPKRIEEGIAPKTIAMMQPASYKTYGSNKTDRLDGTYWTQEIWVMIEDSRVKRKIISAWRYPGMTKVGEPLPEEILLEMSEVA